MYDIPFSCEAEVPGAEGASIPRVWNPGTPCNMGTDFQAGHVRVIRDRYNFRIFSSPGGGIAIRGRGAKDIPFTPA